MWELKLPNFNSQGLALHQNGVEFRQQFIGATQTSLIAPYSVGQRLQKIGDLERGTYGSPCYKVKQVPLATLGWYCIYIASKLHLNCIFMKAMDVIEKLSLILGFLLN